MKDDHMLYNRINILFANFTTEVNGLRGEVRGLRGEVQGLRGEVQGLRDDVAGLRDDVAGLRADVEDLRADVEDLRGQVKNLREDLHNEILLPEANEFGKKATVVIFLCFSEKDVAVNRIANATKDKNTKGPIAVGHGLLLRIGSELFILSAAHVLIDVTHNRDFYLTFKCDEDKKLHAQAGDSLYLPRQYVRTGDCDFAVLSIRLREDTDSNGLHHGKVNFEGKVDCGKSVLGHGVGFIRGPITRKFGDSARFRVATISECGSSGCPLFFNDKSVAGCLHGDSKHRGSRQKNEGSGNEPSPFLYADAYPSDNLSSEFRMMLVAPDEKTRVERKLKLLRMSERIPFQYVRDPTSAIAFGALNSNDAQSWLEVWNKGTWDDETGPSMMKLMEEVAELLWPHQVNDIFSLDDVDVMFHP